MLEIGEDGAAQMRLRVGLSPAAARVDYARDRPEPLRELERPRRAASSGSPAERDQRSPAVRTALMNSSGVMMRGCPPSMRMRSMRESVFDRLLWTKNAGYPETP